MELTLLTMAVLSIDLPTVGNSPFLVEPNLHRARVTVTAEAIVVRPKRTSAEKKVATLKAWVPEPTELDGLRIVPLAKALAPPPPTDELADRFFSSEVDGWVELSIDRGAPWAIVLSVMSSVSEQASTFGCAVRTPSGERLLVVSAPAPGGESADVLTLALDHETLMFVASDGTRGTAKRTVEAARAAVSAFAKKNAKGRRPVVPNSFGPVCLDAKNASLPLANCWRGRVMVAVDGVSWGDVLPVIAATAQVVPWVMLATF